MTKEQHEKGTELLKVIEKYEELVIDIKNVKNNILKGCSLNCQSSPYKFSINGDLALDLVNKALEEKNNFLSKKKSEFESL